MDVSLCVITDSQSPVLAARISCLLQGSQPSEHDDHVHAQHEVESSRAGATLSRLYAHTYCQKNTYNKSSSSTTKQSEATFQQRLGYQCRTLIDYKSNQLPELLTLTGNVNITGDKAPYFKT